jgi:hypothetical protein
MQICVFAPVWGGPLDRWVSSHQPAYTVAGGRNGGKWPSVAIYMDPAARAEQHRKQAERLRQIADAAASEVVRKELLDIAAEYEALAEQLEIENERGDQP